MNSKEPLVIAVEGCNAVGKSHAIGQLKSILEGMDQEVHVFKAPDYTGLHGESIVSFLNGQHLSGNLLYDPQSCSALNATDKSRVSDDYVLIDQLFKDNRQDIQKRIKEFADSCATPPVILIDRWSLSGVVYSRLRFQDLGDVPNAYYYDALVEDELQPHITILLTADPQVIVERMEQRIEKEKSRDPQVVVPVVWTQSRECFQRTQKEFTLQSHRVSPLFTLHNPSESDLQLACIQGFVRQGRPFKL